MTLTIVYLISSSGLVLHKNSDLMNPVLRSALIFRRKTRYSARDLGAFVGLSRRWLRRARGAAIVVYHGICEKQPLRFNNIFLTRATLAQHFRLYREYFNVVSLDDYYRENFDPQRFNIALHFDDGYANNHRYVLPLLDQYRLPATFFLTAVREAGYDILWNDFLNMLARIGPDQLFFLGQRFYKARGIFPRYVSGPDGVGLWEMLRSEDFGAKAALLDQCYSLAPFRETVDTDYWLQMTETQIADLASSPWVTIGAHGYYHNDLARIDPADAEKEIVAGKRWLEKITGKPVTALAFPYGTYTPALVRAAKKASFTRLLPLAIHSADASLRERLIVNPYVSVTNQLLNLIEKRYDFWR
jgi:peptidoglycan/xylan/chitin deacetylase (PgdA/CDA1 family)